MNLPEFQLDYPFGDPLAKVAHLHKLWFDGVLRREHGADGVIRLQQSGKAHDIQHA